jgi:hypothetical protein
MGHGLVVKLRRDNWNELIGHPKDSGRDWSNSRTNSLQPGEDDVDQIAIKVHEDTPEDGDTLANSMDRGTPFGRPISPFGPVAFQEASRTCRSQAIRSPSKRMVYFLVSRSDSHLPIRTLSRVLA